MRRAHSMQGRVPAASHHPFWRLAGVQPEQRLLHGPRLGNRYAMACSVGYQECRTGNTGSLRLSRRQPHPAQRRWLRIGGIPAGSTRRTGQEHQNAIAGTTRTARPPRASPFRPCGDLPSRERPPRAQPPNADWYTYRTDISLKCRQLGLGNPGLNCPTRGAAR